MTKKFTPIINHFVSLIQLREMNDSLKFVEDSAERIVETLGFHCVEKVSHKFSPQGTTVCFVLSESHLIIHTWPEMNSIHIDLFTCSSHTDLEFENSINEVFGKNGIEKIDTYKMIKNN